MSIIVITHQNSIFMYVYILACQFSANTRTYIIYSLFMLVANFIQFLLHGTKLSVSPEFPKFSGVFSNFSFLKDLFY